MSELQSLVNGQDGSSPRGTKDLEEDASRATNDQSGSVKEIMESLPPRIIAGGCIVAYALVYIYSVVAAPYRCWPPGSETWDHCQNNTLNGKCEVAWGTKIAALVVLIFFPLLLYFVASVAENPAETKTREVPPTGSTKQRVELIDNGKFCCNMMIVIAHFGYYNVVHTFHDSETWLKGAEHELLYYVDGFGKVGLHIAALLSGYMCRKDEPSDKATTRAFKLLLLLLSWSMFVKPVFLRSIEGKVNFFDALSEAVTLQSWEVEWYLQALLLWRFAAPLVRQLPPVLAVFLAFVASGLGGYHKLATGVWALDDVVGMFPPFVLGMLLPIESLAAKAPRNEIAKVCALAVSMLWGRCVMTPLTGTEPMFSFGWPDEHGSFADWTHGYKAAKYDRTMGCPLDYNLFFLRRMANQLLLLVPILLIMLVVVPMGEVWFSKLGEHTLYSYLWHEVALIYRDKLMCLLPLPTITNPWMHLVVLLVNVPFAPLISSALCSSVFRFFLSPLMDSGPKLHPYLVRDKKGV